MKKNFNEKQKKSYHELIEEQDSNKEAFKRSEQPRKKPIVIKEEVEKPKFNNRGNDASKKPYKPNIKKEYKDSK